jgi:NifU-like protein involved in Fe-S cluster formation
MPPAMSAALYSKALLRLAADAVRSGRLAQPDATGSAHNPVCGDRVTVDLASENGRIVDIALDSKACVLTQASASLLGQEAIGLVQKDLAELHASVTQMLERPMDAKPPRIDGFRIFADLADYPARRRCVLLPIEAALAAFDALANPKAKRR